MLKHGYAPVEQYTRKGRQGPFTDVYAMAATYYYAVTGRAPQDSIERVTEDNLISPTALGVKLSRDVENALFKALEVQQTNRYRTMGEFAKAIRGGQETAKPDGTYARVNSGVQGNPILRKAEAYLKDGKWAQAEVLCEAAIEENGDDNEAKILMAMAKLKVSDKKEFYELSSQKEKNFSLIGPENKDIEAYNSGKRFKCSKCGAYYDTVFLRCGKCRAKNSVEALKGKNAGTILTKKMSGTQISGHTHSSRFCTECGNRLAEGSKFCSNCGTLVRTVSN